MPQVKIEKEISLSPDEAFDKIASMLKNSKELKQVEPNLEVKEDPKNHEIKAKGKKINGSAKVTALTDGSGGSQIHLEIELPWTLAPFKGLVQAKLEEKVSQMC